MFPRLANPSALVLLFSLPWVYWCCRKSLSGLSRTRQWLALVLRSAILILLVLALAGLGVVRKTKDICVYFVLDESRSIPADLRGKALEYVNTAAGDSRRKEDDQAGLIVFGGNAGIEAGPQYRLRVQDIRTVLNPEATDLAGAIRLASAAFPESCLKRIVLVSDGNENRGNAEAEIQQARASGVVVDVLPLEYARGAEVLVEKLILPSEVLPDAEFEIKVVVKSFQTTDAVLQLYENARSLARQKVKLFPDRPNVFSVTRTLNDPDFYTYEAVIEPEVDTIPQNNRGYGFVDVRGDPRILFITGNRDGQDDFLWKALQAEGLLVTAGGVEEIPAVPEQMQRWDLLVLSNVPASAMTGGKNSQMAMIRDAVRNSGIGLLVIGGDNAFGAGAYKGTEIEEALPVEMDVTQKKILPSGAIVIVMDAIDDPSIPNGNAWAREVCKAALDGISSRDQIGIYTMQWFLPLTVASDKAAIRAKINSMVAMDYPPGAGIRAAHEALSKASAGIKHVVVISDSGEGGLDGVLQKMVEDRITVSAVVIGPHGQGMTECMESIARSGRGNFYYPRSAESLPHIFFKEAAIVRKSLIWDKEPFRPKMSYSTPPLSGIHADGIPLLEGYVVTTAKTSPLVDVPIVSHNDDPIFAHWRYGLGKSVAFTSDARNGWGKHWVAWPNYSRLWAQTARWCMRATSGWDYTVRTQVEGAEGRIVVDALNEKGEFVNFLEIDGIVTSPDAKTQQLRLSQTGPGRYEGAFRAEQVGTHTVALKDGNAEGTAPFRTGVSVSYSPEYRQFETNHALLKRMAEASGGRVLRPSDSVYDRNLPAIEVSRPIWSALLLLAICLFPFDVFVRRVMIDYDRVLGVVRGLLARLPVIGERWRRQITAEGEAMKRLLQRKREVRAGEAPKVDVTGLPGLERTPGLGDASSPVEPAPTPAEPGTASKSRAGEPEPTSTYTQRLLAAKRRAQKKKPE